MNQSIHDIVNTYNANLAVLVSQVGKGSQEEIKTINAHRAKCKTTSRPEGD
jgi:hypothetical protein